MRIFKTARACVVKSPSSSMDQFDQKQLFDRFCVEQFKDRDAKTSKTISSRERERTTNCECHQDGSIGNILLTADNSNSGQRRNALNWLTTLH